MLKQDTRHEKEVALDDIRCWLKNGATISASNPDGPVLEYDPETRTWRGGLTIRAQGIEPTDPNTVKRLERRLAKRDRRIAGMERRIARLERALADRTMDMERLSNNVGQEVMRAMCNVRLIPVRGIADEPVTLDGRHE